MEKEFNRQIQTGGNGLRKDSKRFLEIVLQKREELGADDLALKMEDFKEIPNIKINARAIFGDLKAHGCISDSSSVVREKLGEISLLIQKK